MSYLFILIILIILFLIVDIFFISIHLKNKRKIENFKSNAKNNNNNIWMYWENKKGKSKSDYLKLCYKTVLNKCSKNFNIYLLDENTVHNFLPNLRKDINYKLNIPQKTDYIRLNLLYKYGGIWLDSDIIVINDLSTITEKLKNYDFVGFGCHFKDCSNSGYPNPANWVLSAKKNSILMKKCIEESDKLLEENNDIYFKKNYHILGRRLLWKNIKKLKKENNWDYYHFDSRCLERDSNNIKFINERFISSEDIDLDCKNMLFVPVYNTAPGFPKWFLEMSEIDHLKSQTLFSKFIRKGLKKN